MFKITTRRRFLTTLGVAAAGTVAGCGGDSDGDTTTDTSTVTSTTTATTTTTTTTTTTPNQEAREQYDRAVEALAGVKDQLDTWAEEGFDGDADSLETLRDDLSSARESLDRAESHAGQSDLAARIEQARHVAEFQELNIAYYDRVLAFGPLISDARAFGNSEQHERSAEKWSEAEQLVEDTRGVVDELETAHESIDTEVLGEDELDYSDDPLDYIDLEDGAALDAAEAYTGAYRRANLAIVRLQKGNTHYENQEYASAGEDWEAGRSHLEAALASFEAVVDNDYAPQNFNDDSINQIGVVETLIEAFDKFVRAAEEAEAGDVETANQLIGEGYDIIEGE